jgi:hypothetical protein
MEERLDGGVGMETREGAAHDVELEQDPELRCWDPYRRGSRGMGCTTHGAVDHGTENWRGEVERWDEVSSRRPLVIESAAWSSSLLDKSMQ